MTDAPPRPIDDLTRDLRARTVYESSKLVGSWFAVPEAFKTLIDPLTLEAADAIDRLRAALDCANMIIADAKIDYLTHQEPTGPTTWTIATAFEQLEKCGYACEAGPLENNVAYCWLKRDLAAKTVKAALDALRPILMHHRLTDAFISPSGRRCSCRFDVADPRAWIDHVLSLLAFGAEPPADARIDFEENFHPILADLRARADGIVGSHVRFGHATEASNAIYEALKWAAGWR